MRDSVVNDGVNAGDSTKPAPVSVVMISLNEAHNIPEVLANLRGFASEVLILDSFSSDETVDLALAGGAVVGQHGFRGFGDQWNFALRNLPISQPWTMKLDPDERLTDELKASLRAVMLDGAADGIVLQRRLWFMNRPLTIRQDILRVWRSGACRFTNVLANEQPVVGGTLIQVSGDLEHHDSPNLHHWIEKQNAYTTAEAYTGFVGNHIEGRRALFGSSQERRNWYRSIFFRLPFRYALVWLHCYVIQGAWSSGSAGRIWAALRVQVFRMWDYKSQEMAMTGVAYRPPPGRTGSPHPAAIQFD